MSNPEIDSEIAYGEALGTSFLLAMVLKRMVQKGIFSDPEIADLIDQTLLSLEKMQGDPRYPSKAIARARANLEATLQPFSGRHQSPPAH